jgi:hypothetical protein
MLKAALDIVEGREIDLLKNKLSKLGVELKATKDTTSKEALKNTIAELKSKIKKAETIKEAEDLDSAGDDSEYGEQAPNKPLHPSIKMNDAIRQLEQMLKDMKAHLGWERKIETKEMEPKYRSQHEHELLYYEQQIDMLEATIEQLKSLANKGKEINESYYVISKKSRSAGKISGMAGQKVGGITIKDKYDSKEEADKHAKILDKHASSMGYEVVLVESEQTFKVGDFVVPNIGPHKGLKHKVIHVHSDGKINIKPEGLTATKIKYRQGAVTAESHQVKKLTS